MDCKKFESLIEKYIDGELRKNELELFEEHYFTCDKCFYSLKLQENLKENNVSIVPKEEKRTFLGMVLKPSLIVSSILVVFLSAFLFINHRNELIKINHLSSFKPPEYISNETRNNGFGSRFEKAMELYNRSDYSAALKKISDVQDDRPKVIFFKGIIKLLNNDPKGAISCFDKILNKMYPAYFDEAIYYKGIALLKLNRKKSSVKELKKLAEMYSPLKEKAEHLIKEIESL